jgi:hypothetical protein
MTGMRAFNTDRKMSVPALQIDPPTQFKKEYLNLLMGGVHPFHRRGTEVSRGYDVYQMRKHSLSHLNDRAWSPVNSLSKTPSALKNKRVSEPGTVRF